MGIHFVCNFTILTVDGVVDDLWRFNTVTYIWEYLDGDANNTYRPPVYSGTVHPGGISASTVALRGNNLYVFGGFRDGITNYIY